MTAKKRIRLKIFLPFLFLFAWLMVIVLTPLPFLILNIVALGLVIAMLSSASFKQKVYSIFRRTPPEKAPIGKSILFFVLSALNILFCAAGISAQIQKKKLEEAGLVRQQQLALQDKREFENHIKKAHEYAKTDENTELAISSFEKVKDKGGFSSNDKLVFAGLLKKAGQKHFDNGSLDEAIDSVQKATELTTEIAGLDSLLASMLCTRAEKKVQTAKEQEEGDEVLARSHYKEALDDYREVLKLDQGAIENPQKITNLEEKIKILDQKLAKEKRKKSIKLWLSNAREIVNDKGKCNTLTDLKSACENLEKIKTTDDEYHQARALGKKVNKCRTKALNDFRQGLKEVMIIQRKEMANKLEESLLMQGLDVRISVQGSRKDILKMKYALFNRAWAYKMTNGGDASEGSFLGNLEAIGFKEVIFTDGWSDRFSWNLSPSSEKKEFDKSFKEWTPCKI